MAVEGGEIIKVSKKADTTSEQCFCLLAFLFICVGLQFLQDTLDALFNIMMETSEEETYDTPVFNALASIEDFIEREGNVSVNFTSCFTDLNQPLPLCIKGVYVQTLIPLMPRSH